MRNSRIEAAMPSTASARLSQRLLSFSSDLLQLSAEFLQHGLGVDALGARLLDPVLDDRTRALLGLGAHLVVGGNDAGASGLERIEAHLVGLVPGLAVRARGELEAVLLDDLLVLLREVVLFGFVHVVAE